MFGSIDIDGKRNRTCIGIQNSRTRPACKVERDAVLIENSAPFRTDGRGEFQRNRFLWLTEEMIAHGRLIYPVPDKYGVLADNKRARCNFGCQSNDIACRYAVHYKKMRFV